MCKKTIICDIRSTPDQAGYLDRGTVIAGDDKSTLWHDSMSSCPNPYQLSTGQKWKKVYGWCGTPGNYAWECVQTALHGVCLRLSNCNGEGKVPTCNANSNHRGEHWADGVLVHCGDSEIWRGSAACHTIAPSKWPDFIALFAIGETGVYLIKKDAESA